MHVCGITSYLLPLPIITPSSLYSFTDSSYHVTLCRVGSASDNTSAGSCIIANPTVTTSNFNTLGSSSGSNLQSGAATAAATVINPSTTLVTASGSTSGGNSSVQSSNSRLQIGLQASLHVQQWRLCLIGEPSAGCQFIAQWRLDALDAAYTMESNSISNVQNAFSGTAFDSTQNFLGFTPPGTQSAIGGFASGVTPYDDRFFLEANRAAGKGLMGNYVFQVDGRRLNQLAHAIEELMLRRFPALTAPPGTRVLPSTTTSEDSNTESLHLRKSAAIDIRRGPEKMGSLPFGQLASSSSLSPPGTGGGAVFGGSASPQGLPGLSGSAVATFAPSSLPTRGGHIIPGPVSGLEELQQQNSQQQHSSSASSSSRSKKSSHHRPLFGAQTLGRSDAIKIPTRRFTTALSKMTGEGCGSSRGRSSSKAGSADGSAEGGSSSDASSQTKPQPSLYFPSVMVGAGIITSLVPAPPPQSQSSVRPSDGVFVQAGQTTVPPPRSKIKSEQLPPTPLQTSTPTPPPPPPPPSSCLLCDRCQRRSQRRGGGGGHQKTPSSISSEEFVGLGSAAGDIFAADEDADQSSTSPPPIQRERIPPSLPQFYALYKLLYRTVEPFHKNRLLSRSGSLDVCASRRRKLVRERVFEALGGGEGSTLDRILLKVAPPHSHSKSCVFLLVFSPPLKSPSMDEMDYRWYLVHRPGNCCSRCCLWNTPILLSELNIQDVVANQNRILTFDKKECSATTDLERQIPCGGVPCLSTSGLFVWRFAEVSQCTSHPKTNLSRPWSVLYLSPDSEIDDGASPISNTTSSFCCYCGSPINQPRRRSRVSQSSKTAAPTEHKSSHQQQQSTNYHAYANLIRSGNGSSTLPSVSRRAHHHQTAPVVFPGGKLVPSPARDVPDSGTRRGAIYTTSTSCSTSQASSPNSPQAHAPYCNLSAGTGPTCLPPNPLKYSQVFQEERGAYANLQHLSISFNPTSSLSSQQHQTRWRGSRPSNDLVPDEIREPRRNYALVDLRPSPASSVITPGDTITLVSTSEDAVSINSDSMGNGVLVGSGGNKTDSSASTLHTNTSTSSAATIVPVGSGNRPRTASSHRRTLSHSLTAILPVPTLNYVHIMTKKDAAAAAAAAASTNQSSLVGCESPASSSSTASSSEKEQRAPVVSCSNPCPSSATVPYAQIDFERTRALNAVNGTPGSSEMGHFHSHHHNFHQQKGLGGQSIASKNASMVGMGGGLRGLNMRKKSDGW
ncbi:unnamed protein product [Hymenolepis diminuta]|uniref:IRS-type PTB domain-containing protein n=2 Tax=Hymenolepis diminuta TaxID=6216 RepID=A0A0R3SRA6_HYMDI|nr:unnamed protein product [Hymenolepis diminuta]